MNSETDLLDRPETPMDKGFWADDALADARFLLDPSVRLDWPGDGVLIRRAGLPVQRVRDAQTLALLRTLQAADAGLPWPRDWRPVAAMLSAGWLALEWRHATGSALLRARVPGPAWRTQPLAPHASLHPATWMAHEREAWVLRNPDSAFELRLRADPQAAWPWGGAGMDAPALKALLWLAGLSEVAGAVDPSPWDAADRYFHLASRGRPDGQPRGATYRQGRAWPPVKSLATTAAQRTHQPGDLRALGELPFVDVLQQRRSTRGVATPLAREDLERLLRLSFADVMDERTARMPCKARAFASAGGMHELDVYVVAARLNGLAPGVYRFCCEAGALQPVAGASAALDRMLAEARQAWGSDLGTPSGLIVLCADLRLMTWRYEGIAYRLSLLNAGHASAVICQIASALGVGLCPLGSGNADAFATASGHNEWELPAVAELALAGAVPPIRNNTSQRASAQKEPA